MKNSRSLLRTNPKKGRTSNKRSHLTGADIAYDLLRRRILSLEIPPKADLDETELAAACEVSRTPLREALIRLAADRLIVQMPNRGFVVAPLLLPDFPQFIEALAINQGAVSALAASNRTETDLEEIRSEARRFSDTISRNDLGFIVAQNSAVRMRVARAGKNEYFVAAYGRLLDESVRLAHTFFIHDQQPRRWIDDHDRLLQAITVQDANAAERLGRLQAVEFQKQILAYLEGHELAAVPTLSPPRITLPPSVA